MIRTGWLKLAPLFCMLGVTACQGFPLFWKRDVQASLENSECTSQGGGVLPQDALPGKLELADVRYDGETLSGRLLVTPVTHGLRLDKRLISYSHINVSAVSACGTGELVPFVIWDAVPPQAREKDLLILECGYWYGTTMSYKLFIERVKGLGPECIDVQLVLLSFDGKPVASQHVQVTRTHLPPVDGGTPEEPSPTAGAGPT
jgi:hypothetical protein